MKKYEKEFKEAFGEEIYNQQKILDKLQKEIDKIAETYLGIEPIPVVFGQNMEDDEAMYDGELQAILLNPKNQEDYIQLLESCLHELEHHYQIFYANAFDTPKAKRWKKELENYQLGNPMQEIEIDAYAFAQVVLMKEYGITYKHPDEAYQTLIHYYIVSKRILEE